MKKYFKYIAVLLSFVIVFSLSGFAALQTVANVFAADSPDTGDNSGTDSPSAGDNSGDNTGTGSPSAGDNSGDEQNSDWEYAENEDGTIKITKYNFDGKDRISLLEVPVSIDGKKVTVIGEKAFENDGYIILNKLAIPEGVKEIEKDALLRCHAYSIDLPSTIEKIENISTYQSGSIIYVPSGSKVESLVEKIAEKEYGIAVYHKGNIYIEGNYTYSVNDDDTVTILAASGGLPEKIDGKTVTAIGRYAYFRGSASNAIVVPESVEFIGSYAFNNSNISSITIKNASAKLEWRLEGYFNEITIKGFTNSTAEEYAKANNWAFESIGVYEKPTEPETEAPTEKPSESETEAPAKPEKPIDNSVHDDINSGEKVVETKVEAGNGSVVPTDFVTAVIEKGAQLILEVKSTDGKPLVKYTIDGTKFTKAPDANLKLDVICGEKNAVTDKVKEQLNVTGDDSLFLCNFEHSGELNGELAVTVYPNYDNGTELKLFYYNEATGKAEDMGQTVKVENGEVTFTVTHFSSYLLVKTADIVTPSEPGTTEPENPGESEPETTEPGNNPSEPETTNPETTPSVTQPETTPSQAETEPASTEPESGNYVAPSTGARTGSAAALVGVMLMACGAAGVCVGKRKK